MLKVTPSRSQEEILNWLALVLTPGLGAKRARDLLSHFGSPAQVMRATASELEAAGAAGSVARSLASGCAFEDAAETADRMKNLGITAVPFDDSLYPEQLRQIYDPPVLLFALGKVELLGTVMAAIVGSRRASTYGTTVAERLGHDLALEGITIVSGMARGIDTAAHIGALAAGGGTVAVFGCGLDVIYPAENRKLAEQIAREGLILSEFPPGVPAHPQNFPIRNRTISGLCEGVIVVEGQQYSGSLITARLALDQNREVFAVPGNITSKFSFGPNLLLKQGAQLVQSASDVVDGLNWDARARLSRQERLLLEPEAPASLHPMAGLAAQILALLKVDAPTQIDDLIESIPESSSSEIIAVLFELEDARQVRQLPGRSYVKVWSE